MLKNINTALESDIEAIGITQQIAKYIIDSRNYFNGFANIADLDKLDLTSEEKSLLIQNFLFEPISSVQIKINDATEEDLQSIGIDAEWSKYIIDSRNYKGRFTSKDDLNTLELSPEHIKLLSDNFIFEDLIAIPDEITTDRQKIGSKDF
ncbi:MAG: helix-hairpin-helix domain-containing protein [Ignavibacteria bacterium]|nr:helix-hairpin-helix domain-containing protein [Ignavibacteria bacterium]